MRLLQAILMAMWNLAKGTGNAAIYGLDWTWRSFWGLFGFGGAAGSATPGPLDLPSKEVFDVDRSIEEGHQRTAETLANCSPAMQVKLYASAKADDRFCIDLSKLEPDHQDWLIGLSSDEKAMRALSEAPESKIAMLLGGHDGAVPGLGAPKAEKAKEIIPGLSERILDFRLIKSSRELDHVLAA